MSGNKRKAFRDAVHGYISVPSDWCDAFVDTPIFQRLKYIEQTSMRPLYPCARHDRFSHSLGVYHLAATGFQRLCENSNERVLDGVDLARYRTPFLAAALMHDCAHSPFSHTFEEHYGRGNRAEEFLLSVVDDSFQKDYAAQKTRGEFPSPHEMFSAAVFLTHYRDVYTALDTGGDPVLVARMITGCGHELSKTAENQIEDCLIRLIKGRAIDLDKLDYVMRDTWSSGVNNVSIDSERLLSALEIAQGRDKLELVFRKSALSVLTSVVDGRNYLRRWVYCHHTVQYWTMVLKEAVMRLDQLLSRKRVDLLDVLFSKEVFAAPVAFGRYRFYLPTDSELLGLLKSQIDQIPQVLEMLTRKPSLVPLWKTEAEFEHIFREKSTTQRTKIKDQATSHLAGPLGDAAGRCRIVPVKPSIVAIDNHEILVKLVGELVPFEDIAVKWQERCSQKENVSFFYVYIPRECEDKINACVTALKSAPV